VLFRSVGADLLPLPRTTPVAARVGERVAVGIRPEYTAPAGGDMPRLNGTVVVAEPLGSETLVHAELQAAPVLSDQVLEVAKDADEGAAAELEAAAADQRTRFRARFTGTHRGQGGEPVAIGIDVERLYFFDLKTGGAIA